MSMILSSLITGVIKKNIESSHADLNFPAVLVTMYSGWLIHNYFYCNNDIIVLEKHLLVSQLFYTIYISPKYNFFISL